MTGGGEPDDAALVRSFCRDGDEQAFRALYRRHAPALHGLLRRMAGGEAEDLLQEAWLRAARALSSFRGASSLRTWLFGIGLNCARERLRERGRWEGIDGEPAVEGGDGAAALDLAGAVEGLAPGYRAVLLLHDAWGYTHEEIAALLGIVEGTSKSQLARAREAVRARLGGTARGGRP